MKVVIRADASVQIGIGHIMRCLTLADELTANGASVQFVCRAFPGHMGEFVKRRGYELALLPVPVEKYYTSRDDPEHANWLGTSWEKDADDVLEVIGNRVFDWLIVDHYGIDARWHMRVRGHTRRIMVIDDLADRQVHCDLFLDQTYGRGVDDYSLLTPDHCRLLIGAQYALLRPEFKQMRQAAKERRQSCSGIKHILVCMGGTDPDNASGKVIGALAKTTWRETPVIDVIIGSHAPFLDQLVDLVQECSLDVNIFTDVANIAEMMVAADFAIGAGGSTSWERCVLGLPSAIIAMAQNQVAIARNIASAGAAVVFEGEKLPTLVTEFVNSAQFDKELYQKMSTAAFNLCHGEGASHVVNQILR